MHPFRASDLGLCMHALMGKIFLGKCHWMKILLYIPYICRVSFLHSFFSKVNNYRSCLTTIAIPSAPHTIMHECNLSTPRPTATMWVKWYCSLYTCTFCRISFPSLLFLKHQLLHLLKDCKKPKVQVMFEPRWVEEYIPRKLRQCFCRIHVDPDFDMDRMFESIKAGKYTYKLVYN